MNCPYCQKEALWCENKVIYGKNLGKSYMCYHCKDCDAHVGCHKNTKRPLGTMANKELRKLRVEAHALFDPLWKRGKMSRNQVYAWLSHKMGTVIHIGESDKETCRKIIEILSTKTP